MDMPLIYLQNILANNKMNKIYKENKKTKTKRKCI